MIKRWQYEAVCTPEDMVLMFSELKSKVARMKAICATCPVQAKCLEFALDPVNEITAGIFGGTTEEERDLIRRLTLVEV